VTILQGFGLLLVVGVAWVLWSFWKEYRNRANGPNDRTR